MQLIKIRLDILIALLEYLQNPSPIFIQKYSRDILKIVDHPKDIGNYLLYNLKEGRVIQQSPNWCEILLSFVERGMVHRCFSEENPELCEKIREWF